MICAPEDAFQPRSEALEAAIRKANLLIINTPLGKTSFYDEQAIRKAALQFNTPCVTTITGAEALIEAIATKMAQKHVTVRSLQEIHSENHREHKEHGA